MSKTPTARPTIGLFGYLFSPDGKLLVKRREQNESLPGEWDLPGGGAEEEIVNAAKNEKVIFQEVIRETREEIGIDVAIALYIPSMTAPKMHPAVISGGKDWAFGINVGTISSNPKVREGVEWKLVSPEELEELANGPLGNRLVSGPGKRMHRLCLYGLAEYSPNEDYREQAFGKLLDIA